MPYMCTYEFCDNRSFMAAVEGVHCSKCGTKVFHKDCFEEHNKEKHRGKADPKQVKEMRTNIGCVIVKGEKIKQTPNTYAMDIGEDIVDVVSIREKGTQCNIHDKQMPQKL